MNSNRYPLAMKGGLLSWSAVIRRLMIHVGLLFAMINSSDAFLVPPITTKRVETSYPPLARIHTKYQEHFATGPVQTLLPSTSSTRLFASSPNIDNMRVNEMRVELESYGISTKAYLEKREFQDALKKARAEGMESVVNDGPATDETQDGSNNTGGTRATTATANGDTKNASGGGGPTTSPAERLQDEIENAKSMRVSELKSKLNKMGINTKSFFEKTEFVRAYAEAIVDGLDQQPNQGGSSEEDYDPEYRDVMIQKFGKAQQQQMLLGGTVIDITL